MSQQQTSLWVKQTSHLFDWDLTKCHSSIFSAITKWMSNENTWYYINTTESVKTFDQNKLVISAM